MPELGSGDSRRLAGIHDPLDPPSPGLDHPGAEEGIGDVGVVGLRGVLPNQVIDGPVVREVSGIPDEDLILVDAYLDGDAAAVVLMSDGIEQGLAKSLLGHWVGLDPLESLVGDGGLQVFGEEEVEGFVSMGEEVSLDLVVVEEVGVGAEVADLHGGSGHVFLGIGVKEQDGGPLQVGAVGEVELLQEFPVGLLQDLSGEALATERPAAKLGEGAPVEIGHADMGHGDSVPVSALLSEQEAVEGGTLQLLLRAAAAVVVFPLVADGVGIGLDNDLDQVVAFLPAEIHIDEDAEDVADLVRDLLEEFPGILHPNGLALVVFPNDEGASLGIGKAADPPEVVIPPAFLPLDGLVFGHLFLQFTFG